jgi:hypothetical protein
MFFLDNNGNPIDCCADITNPFDPNFDVAKVAVCFPIQVPRNDPYFKGRRTCMNFARSQGALDIDCQPGPIQQVLILSCLALLVLCK